MSFFITYVGIGSIIIGSLIIADGNNTPQIYGWIPLMVLLWPILVINIIKK
jgi:hypothetical protein